MWKILLKIGFWIGLISIGPVTVVTTLGILPVLSTAAVVQLL